MYGVCLTKDSVCAASVMCNWYKADEAGRTSVEVGSPAEAALPFDDVFDATELVISPVGNVASKVWLVVNYIGSLVSVDDLGSCADVSNGTFGTHLVRRLGCYGDDCVNSEPSSG